jgi:hypothetical protein
MVFGIDLEQGIRPVWWDVLVAVVGGVAVAWTVWVVTGWALWIEVDASAQSDAGEAVAATLDGAGPPTEMHDPAQSEAVGAQSGISPGRERTSRAEAMPPESVWDFERWSRPERVLVVVIAFAAPLGLMLYVDGHVSQQWADWVAVPVISVGDLVAAGLFILLYGTARAWLRPKLGHP